MDIKVLPDIVFQIINFLIVFFVLKKFLYKPVLSILDQRSKRIADGLRAADKNIKAAQELEEKEKKVLSTARAEASKLTKQAQKDAKKQAGVILEEAKKDAEKVLDKERKTLQATFDAEKAQLEKSVSTLVTKTTEALLKQYLTADQQKKIVTQQIKDLKQISLS